MELGHGEDAQVELGHGEDAQVKLGHGEDVQVDAQVDALVQQYGEYIIVEGIRIPLHI